VTTQTLLKGSAANSEKIIVLTLRCEMHMCARVCDAHTQGKSAVKAYTRLTAQLQDYEALQTKLYWQQASHGLITKYRHMVVYCRASNL
jgi:hypothetical protein